MKKINGSKGILIFSMIIIIIYLVGCAPLGPNNLRGATNKELKLFNQAVETNDISVCYNFNPYIEKRTPAFSSELTFRLRNHCFYSIAINTKNPDLCNEMSHVLGDNFKEASKKYQEECVKKSNR